MKVFICLRGDRFEKVEGDLASALIWVDAWYVHYEAKEDGYIVPTPLNPGGRYRGGKLVGGIKVGAERYTVVEYEL